MSYLHEQVEAKIAETFARARELWPAKAEAWSRDRLTVRYDLGGSTAGQINILRRGGEWRPDLRVSRVRFNQAILDRFPERFIARTVPHEIAHYIADVLHPRSRQHHGATWKAVMSMLGLEASRCHSYDTTGIAKRRRTFAYNCNCEGKTHGISAVKHNRLLRRTHRYVCLTCRQPILPVVSSVLAAAAPTQENA